jgi:hypothetical protein
MRKFFISIGCISVYVLIVTTIRIEFRFILGALPTMVLFGSMLWLESFLHKKSDIKKVEKEAYAKGMSIRQYITSVVPSSLINFCEIHKGKSDLANTIKQYVEEDVIPKHIAVVLLEMYK